MPPVDENPGNKEFVTSEVANAWAGLRMLGRKPRPTERCELCSVAVPPGHSHLIELSARRILCACDACALLFDSSSNRKYKRVPRRVRLLQSFHISDANWDALLVPINMAFFFSSSTENRVVVLYPSPAGAVESLLSLESWNGIVRENPILNSMEQDVEALLVNRIEYARGSAPAEYFVVPIDQCYRLVGLIRAHWKGLSGGAEAWQEIGNFFAELRQRAEVITTEESHA